MPQRPRGFLRLNQDFFPQNLLARATRGDVHGRRQRLRGGGEKVDPQAQLPLGNAGASRVHEGTRLHVFGHQREVLVQNIEG